MAMLGRPTEAVLEACRLATRINPQDPVAWKGVATLAAALGLVHEALEAVDAAEPLLRHADAIGAGIGVVLLALSRHTPKTSTSKSTLKSGYMSFILSYLHSHFVASFG